MLLLLTPFTSPASASNSYAGNQEAVVDVFVIPDDEFDLELASVMDVDTKAISQLSCEFSLFFPASDFLERQRLMLDSVHSIVKLAYPPKTRCKGQHNNLANAHLHI